MCRSNRQFVGEQVWLPNHYDSWGGSCRFWSSNQHIGTERGHTVRNDRARGRCGSITVLFPETND